VILTTQKLLEASKILKVPVIATTQLSKKLGPTCSDLRLDQEDGYPTAIHADKSLFSMWTPEVQSTINDLYGSAKIDAIIVGIESHICVTQTTLDLLAAGHGVYVIADGVSSCNKEEIPIALARLRAEGAKVTSSESWMYEYMRDASLPEFKQMAALVKQSTGSTREALGALCAKI
jgi:hypothetical protein